MADLKEAEAIQKLIPLLQNHEAFVKSKFPPERIPEFAEKAEIEFYWQGNEIIKQGDQDDRFFVVISGVLKAIDPNSDPPRLLSYLHPGDIFGMRAILRNSVRAATVEAVSDAVVAAYDRDDWNWLISQEPRIGDYFENIEHRFDERAEAKFPGVQLQADEVIVRAVKRHIIAFIATLTWPIAILMIPVLFLIGMELFGFSLLSALTDNLALLVIIAPFIVLAGLIALYNYLDWYNDDLIVTTKRVIHMERILLFGEERHEIPLTQIQNVTVKTHGILDLFLDVDDIEIKSAAVGTIAVDNVPSAQEISRIILQEQQRAKERAAASDTAAVRQLVTERMQKNVLAPTQTDAPALKVVPASTISLPSISLPSFKANYFWPSTQEVTRIKGEEGILWRKHYYILLRQVFLPLLVLIVSLYLLLTSLVTLPLFDYLDNSWLIQLVLGVAVLTSLFWYIWEYDGWRRDVYIVTDTKIIDVDSSSFRLQGEQLREGPFDSIQNITYTIPNFFYKLLNLGDVIIETAGAGKTFTFDEVLNPSSVQAEIFRRWDNYQQTKQNKQRAETNKQIMTVLGEYHDLTHPLNPQ